jgi:adenine-specific DNA-methyltransferase
LALLARCVADLNRKVDTVALPKGFIEELYAPRDESNITADDRVFYTRANARRLDNYRRLIETYPQNLKDFFLGPLLSEASIHVNTAGVFKGFYKNCYTRVGQFGGTNLDAISRIKGAITLDVPVLSNYECDVEVLQEDANQAARRVRNVDLAYLDPPYNQHPYGSNYFMLNLVVNYKRPASVSRVAGIPSDWRRSGYNVKSTSPKLLADLVAHLDAPYILVLFNNEGFISLADMRQLLSSYGKVDTVEVKHTAFRGSRNLFKRPTRTTEYFFIVERA